MHLRPHRPWHYNNSAVLKDAEYSVPSMESGMPFLYCYEQTLSRCTQVSITGQSHPNVCPVFFDTDHFSFDGKYRSEGSRPPEFDAVGSGNCARRRIFSGLFHQCYRSGPISVTVKQRPDYSSVDHPRKSLVLLFWLELQMETILTPERANHQPLGICRTAAEADAIWCMLLLYRQTLSMVHGPP